MLKISVFYIPQWAQIGGYFPSLNPTDQLLREAKSAAVSPEEATKKYCNEISDSKSCICIRLTRLFICGMKNSAGKLSKKML
jgi:hypothetical protein